MIGGFEMKILVTGGAGYIGSHTCVELLEACLLYYYYQLGSREQ